MILKNVVQRNLMPIDTRKIDLIHSSTLQKSYWYSPIMTDEILSFWFPWELQESVVHRLGGKEITGGLPVFIELTR